jgi:CspA family cold shock protein
MNRGKVLFFDPYKGFGKIEPLDHATPLFVHVNGLVDQVKEGNIVSYEVKTIEGMEQAYDVRKINLDNKSE